MDYKKQYQNLVKQVRSYRKARGYNADNPAIAEILGISDTHFASLAGESGTVTEKHIKKLKSAFPEVFENRSIEVDERRDEEPDWRHVLRISLAALVKFGDSNSTDLKKLLSVQETQGRGNSKAFRQLSEQLEELQVTVSSLAVDVRQSLNKGNSRGEHS